MPKILRNIDEVAHTIEGQVIPSGSEYLIQPQELARISESDALIARLVSGAIVVSDGVSDISGVSRSLGFLKDNLPRKTIQVFGQSSYTVSPRGTAFNAQPGSVTQIDKLLDAALAIRGGIIYVAAPNHGDKITASIVDLDNVLGAGAGYVAKVYVPEWYVMPGRNDLTEVSVDQLPVPGLFFRLSYDNVGPAPVSGILNLLSYEMKP